MTLADALVYVIDDEMSMRKAIGRLLESEVTPSRCLQGLKSFLPGLPI
jgi:FixJ family two-component response regulator